MSWLPLIVLLSLLEEGVTESTVDEIDRPRSSPVVVSRSLPHLHLDMSLWSTYVWRGQRQYTSVSTPSFQPDLTIGFSDLGPGALSFDLWTAFSMNRDDYRPENGSGSEIDLTLRYDMSLLQGWLEVGVGFIYYIYPNAEAPDGEKEILLELGLGNLPISLSVVTFTQLHPMQGIYIEPTLGWEQSFDQVTVGMDISMAASVYHQQDAILEHITLGARMAHAVGRMSVWLNLSYSLRLAPGAGSFFERSLLYGGVGFAVDITDPPSGGDEDEGEPVQGDEASSSE